MFFIYLCYNITTNFPTCFDPQETIIGESNEGNTTFNKIKLDVKEESQLDATINVY
jgi:hypothetical protein